MIAGRGAPPSSLLLPPSLSCLALTIAFVDASPVLCAPSVGWDVARILMLLLIVGQGFAILALSVLLWRRRVRAAQDVWTCHFEPEIQVYENIHLAHLR
uniref:Uncharacterized protein n=1 Tax=Oryctolagus cuniculus TaxID=9986 RepID=A0A5F9DTH2_RABIT